MWEKLKTTKFWVAVGSALVIVCQALGLQFDAPVINEVIASACTVLVIVGFMSGDSVDADASETATGDDDSADNNKSESDDSDDDITFV